MARVAHLTAVYNFPTLPTIVAALVHWEAIDLVAAGGATALERVFTGWCEEGLGLIVVSPTMPLENIALRVREWMQKKSFRGDLSPKGC